MGKSRGPGLTKSRDLRTGRSVWEEDRAPPVPHRALTRDIETDILVIGTGITGAMIAEAVAAAGLRTVVVDRRPPMRGATTASTALVQYEIDTPLIGLARKIGRDKAVRAWRRAQAAVHALWTHLHDIGFEGAVRRDGLYLAGNALDAAALKREAQARNKAGLATLYLGRAALKDRFGIARGGALLSHGNFAADPRAMTATFLNAACEKGAQIFSPAQIVDVDCGKTDVRATTDQGRMIRCRKLVFATGYELPRRLTLKGHRITATWAIATVKQKEELWPEQCLMWEAAEPYLYLRTTPDGRVLCGGEDENISDEDARDALLERKAETLQRKLSKLLPHIDPTIEFAWTASFGESTTGMPFIGEIPNMKNCWAAFGYGGNGIVYARIATEVIAAAVTGADDPDADLYRLRS